MQVMVAMSGGVDSSVAAAMMIEAGHEVVGVTMKLWGGPSDKGCCSVSDVLDARRAADAIGVDHHVFNFGDDFERDVIAPYVAEHDAGRTPNPCIECNRSIKFARLLERADALGFDAVVTGHHAQIVTRDDQSRRIARAVDHAKDQSYVLHMISPEDLKRVEFPVGGLEKSVVRQMAADLGMRVANKPDSQDVCFISSTTSRDEFLGDRLKHTPATVVDSDGNQVGQVESIQLVTIGQRKGLGLAVGRRLNTSAMSMLLLSESPSEAVKTFLPTTWILTRWCGQATGSLTVSSHRPVPMARPDQLVSKAIV
jgi:tRNA-specific 2-thiouridylase